MKRVLPLVIVGIAVGSCLVVHRRVIRSLITGDSMPAAPSWHVWVPQGMRRA